MVVSTLNGHGHIDGMRLNDKICSDKFLKDIPVIIGRKLGISGKNNYSYVDELYNHGFNAVYVDDVNAHEFLALPRQHQVPTCHKVWGLNHGF